MEKKFQKSKNLELKDYYDLIEVPLNDLSKDIDYLYRDNAELQSVNNELINTFLYWWPSEASYPPPPTSHLLAGEA
ncbi:hypothetical protein TorRG33x02_318400 [Trema orientale]|uniref:Uncharacterized protein n=1 Tax=Trema orientale TaxID=63057 RepID=A0A2P5BK43_TREOI|nr:hypothetical protein TorRG33x02_318400 [Trema orientale]